MLRIDVQDICSKNTVTRRDGKKVHDIILKSWNKEKQIIMDFKGLTIASVSFIDEAFGKLAFDFSRKELQEKLNFENIQDYDRALLNDILRSRFKQKELGFNELSIKNL